MKKILTSGTTFWTLVGLAISGIALGSWAINVENQPAGSLNLLWILVALSICGIALCCWALNDFILWILITLAICGTIALCGWAIDFIFWIVVAILIGVIALWMWILLPPKNSANMADGNHDDVIKK